MIARQIRDAHQADRATERAFSMADSMGTVRKEPPMSSLTRIDLYIKPSIRYIAYGTLGDCPAGLNTSRGPVPSKDSPSKKVWKQ